MIGDLIMDRFTLGERLGEGGFGTVHRAWDERLNRPVAVKILAGGDHDRTLREAQAAARLNHPAIATLYELGSDGERSFLVNELVEGETLRALERSGRISDRELAEAGIDLCGAIAHAHEHGVIHRDIKPENVIIRPPVAGTSRRRRGPGRAKLTDFGIARLEDAPRLTSRGGVVGTLAYMAPEYAAGDPGGPESDTYSLALTLYEGWAGENPVEGASAAETARRIGEPVPSLARLRPDLPRELTEIIDAALDPDPAARPDPELLAAALTRALPDLTYEPVPEPLAETAEHELASRDDAERGLVIAAAAAAAALAAFAGAPGVALLVLVLIVAPALVVAEPRLLFIGLAAPVAAALGVAPAAAALAALASTPAARAALGGLAFMSAATASAAGLPLTAPAAVLAAPHGWTGSAAGGFDLLTGALSEPGALLVAASWVALALVLGAIARVREPALSALATLAAVAGVVALARLAGGPEPVLAPAVTLAAAMLVTVDRRELRRARRAARAWAARRSAATAVGRPARSRG